VLHLTAAISPKMTVREVGRKNKNKMQEQNLCGQLNENESNIFPSAVQMKIAFNGNSFGPFHTV